MVRLIGDELIELSEADVSLLRLEGARVALIEGHGLGGVPDETTSSFVQRALGGFARAGRKLAARAKSGLAKLFGRVRQLSRDEAEQSFQHAKLSYRKALDRLIALYYAGRISRAQMHKQARDAVRAAYTQAVTTGAQGAGATSLPTAGERWLDDAVRVETGHLDKVLAELEKWRDERDRQNPKGAALRQTDPVEQKRLETEAPRAIPARIVNRIHRYPESLWHAHLVGRIVGGPPNRLFDWLTARDRRVCKSCRFLEEHSPYTRDTLPTVPKAGQTICYWNCRCRVVARPAEPDAIEKVRTRQHGRAWYLAELARIQGSRRRDR